MIRSLYRLSSTTFRCSSVSFCSSADDYQVNKSYNQLRYKWSEELEIARVPEHEESIDIFIADALGKKTLYGLNHATMTLDSSQIQRVERMVERRKLHEPMQYILGNWDFRYINLKLHSPVFIPRPETELLVDLAISHLSGQSEPTVLEVGCGSGAICLSLLHELPQLKHYFAIDASQEACSLTRENADILKLSTRLSISRHKLSGDDSSLHYLNKFCDGFVDLLISNPPYIPRPDMISLEMQVKDFEPHLALDGGTDGMDTIKDIIKIGHHIITNTGCLILEVDPTHPTLIKNLVSSEESPLYLHRVVPDQYDKKRFVVLKKRK